MSDDIQFMTWAQLLLAKFPSFDPAWPDDIKVKWFADFERLMENVELRCFNDREEGKKG